MSERIYIARLKPYKSMLIYRVKPKTEIRTKPISKRIRSCRESVRSVQWVYLEEVCFKSRVKKRRIDSENGSDDSVDPTCVERGEKVKDQDVDEAHRKKNLRRTKTKTNQLRNRQQAIHPVFSAALQSRPFPVQLV